MAMMAMTTSNSISVKPPRRGGRTRCCMVAILSEVMMPVESRRGPGSGRPSAGSLQLDVVGLLAVPDDVGEGGAGEFAVLAVQRPEGLLLGVGQVLDQRVVDL